MNGLLWLIVIIATTVAVAVVTYALFYPHALLYRRLKTVDPSDIPRGTSLDLSWVYKRFSGTSYALVSHAPNHLNVAMPDFSAEYWITTTRGDGETLRFEGAFPPWSIYSALTAYDPMGNIIASYNKFQYSASQRVAIEFKNKSPMAVLLRVYRPRSVRWTPESDLFSVDSDGVALEMTPRKSARKQSDAMTPLLQTLIPSATAPSGMPFQISGRDATSKGGLFPNNDANYCWSRAPPGFKYGILKFRVPPSQPWRPYIGVMACDGDTSRTDAAVRLSDEDVEVNILFLRHGVNKPSSRERWDHVLRYAEDTLSWFAVVRIVNVSAYGEYQDGHWTFYTDPNQRNSVPIELASPNVQAEGLSPEGLKTVLGRYTPEITWN